MLGIDKVAKKVKSVKKGVKKVKDAVVARVKGQDEAEETPISTRRRNEQVGVVVSAKMTKTVVVAVERLIRHDVYRKTIKRTSTFMAHDEKGAKQGDRVRIVETRPTSKLKRWRVEEILGQGTATADTAAATVTR